MKHVILAFCLVTFGLNGLNAQEKKERKSPPMELTKEIGNAKIKISYSSPSVKGRTIFGDLVSYGKVWRTGANEATVFETSADIMINGSKLPAGKYGLFTIPNEDKWIVIFNSKWDQWGAYKYKEKEDILRVEAKPMALNESKEMFTIEIVGDDTLSIKWASTVVNLELK